MNTCNEESFECKGLIERTTRPVRSPKPLHDRQRVDRGEQGLQFAGNEIATATMTSPVPGRLSTTRSHGPLRFSRILCPSTLTWDRGEFTNIREAAGGEKGLRFKREPRERVKEETEGLPGRVSQTQIRDSRPASLKARLAQLYCSRHGPDSGLR